ncbi:MAG: pyridoxal phosphate-dependent aminotransferase [Thermoplasmata archaeon]
MLDIEIFNWLDDRLSSCRYDLASSGVPRYSLRNIAVDAGTIDLGYEEIRNRFTNKLAEMYGVRQENVIPVNGGSEAIYLAASFLKLNSSRTVIPVPEYEPVIRAPEFIGQDTIKVGTQDIESVLKGGDSIMMTSPNNPEGTIKASGYLMDFIRSSNGSVKYVSETFSDFASWSSPKTIYRKDRGIITSGTLTKFYGLSDLRTGWMIADPDVIKELKKIKNVINVKNSVYSLAAGLYALNNRDIFVSVARNLILENRKIMSAFLENAGTTDPERRLNSTTVFMRYRGREDSITLASRLFQQTGILVTPGKYFGEDHAFRIGYTTDPGKLAEALDILQKFLKSNVTSVL